MLLHVLNAILFMHLKIFFMHIASSICNHFLSSFFIYSYCIISKNLPYIERVKLVCAIAVLLFFGRHSQWTYEFINYIGLV